MCNPMLNSASDLFWGLCKTSMFFLSYFFFFSARLKSDDSVWLFSYLTPKAKMYKAARQHYLFLSYRQLTPSKDAGVWRGTAYKQEKGGGRGRREGGKGGGEIGRASCRERV